MRSLFSRFRNRDRGEKVRKTRKSTAKMNGLLAREVLKKNNASKVSTFYVSSSKIYRKDIWPWKDGWLKGCFDRLFSGIVNWIRVIFSIFPPIFSHSFLNQSEFSVGHYCFLLFPLGSTEVIRGGVKKHWLCNRLNPISTRIEGIESWISPQEVSRNIKGKWSFWAKLY